MRRYVHCAAMLIALGNGLMWPAVMAALSRVAGDTYQGAVQGFASSVGAIASLILGGFRCNLAGAGVLAVSATTILVVAAVACFGKK